MSKFLRGLLVATVLGLPASNAIAGRADAPVPTRPTNCDEKGREDLGTGIAIGKVCKVSVQSDANFADYYDAYYSVRATLKTGPAFSDVGKRLDASAGRVLGRIAQKMFGISRGKSLSIGWKVKIGGQEYPVQTLVSFQRADNGDWTVSTNAMSETLLHRMTALPGAEVTLVYLYSDRATADLNQGRDLIGAAVPWLASPAAEPVFKAAAKVTETIYNANSVKGNNVPTRTLKPSFDEPVLIRFDIKDPYERRPEDAQLIASITIELRGTRSLLRDEVAFDQVAETMPRDGAIDAPKMKQLTSYMFAGSPSKWPVVYTALAGMGTNAPFGTVLKEAEVASFCASADQAITNAFPLSFGDATLLKAAMLKAAGTGIKDQFNPFLVCFDATTRTLINAKLGIDTDYKIEKPPPTLVPGFKSKQLLRTAAAWFTSKSCTEADINASPLADYVADKVEIGPRDHLPAGNTIDGLLVPPPPGNTVARDAFLKATCGAFPYWNTLLDETGTFQVDLVKSDTGWRVTGALSAGKIALFSIVKL